ncbi:hypothetical protein [Arthrobacter sp. TMS1-12-1]
MGVPLIFIQGMIYLFLHPQLTLILDDVMDAEYTGKEASVDDRRFTMQILAGRWNDSEGDIPAR